MSNHTKHPTKKNAIRTELVKYQSILDTRNIRNKGNCQHKHAVDIEAKFIVITTHEVMGKTGLKIVTRSKAVCNIHAAKFHQHFIEHYTFAAGLPGHWQAGCSCDWESDIIHYKKGSVGTHKDADAHLKEVGAA